MKTQSEEFRRDDIARDALKKLLADPVLIRAIRAVKDDLEPLPGGPSEANPVIAASRHHQMSGFNFAIRGLHVLTEPFTEKTPVKPKQHLTKELPEDQ